MINLTLALGLLTPLHHVLPRPVTVQPAAAQVTVAAPGPAPVPPSPMPSTSPPAAAAVTTTTTTIPVTGTVLTSTECVVVLGAPNYATFGVAPVSGSCGWVWTTYTNAVSVTPEPLTATEYP